jgi:hypothetical protein
VLVEKFPGAWNRSPFLGRTALHVVSRKRAPEFGSILK